MRKPEPDPLLARLLLQWAGVHVRVLNLYIDETKPSTAIPFGRFPDSLRQWHCSEFNLHPTRRRLVSSPSLPAADRLACRLEQLQPAGGIDSGGKALPFGPGCRGASYREQSRY